MNKIIPESFYKSGFKKFKFGNLRNINKIKNFIYNESLLLKKNKFKDKSKYKNKCITMTWLTNFVHE